MLIAISEKVTTGHRRADMFSCRMGMSIYAPQESVLLEKSGQCSVPGHTPSDGGSGSSKVMERVSSRGRLPSSLGSSFVFGRAFPQPLQYRGDYQGETYRRIHENLAEFSTFSRGNKLAPGNCFTVGAARESSPVHRLRADTQAVVVALERQVLA